MAQFVNPLLRGYYGTEQNAALSDRNRIATMGALSELSARMQQQQTLQSALQEKQAMQRDAEALQAIMQSGAPREIKQQAMYSFLSRHKPDMLGTFMDRETARFEAEKDRAENRAWRVEDREDTQKYRQEERVAAEKARADEAARARAESAQRAKEMAYLGANLRQEPAPSMILQQDPASPTGWSSVNVRNGQRFTGAPPPPGSTRDPVGNAMEKETYKSGLKQVERDDKDVAGLAALKADLQSWLSLNADVTTGPIAGRAPTNWINPKFQELQRIESSQAMNNFKPGQGAMSNIEREYIKAGGPNTLRDRRANENIVNVMLASIDTMTEKADFKEWYLERNKKLLGADKAWNEYVEKNPRYKRDLKSKDVKPNPNRVPWTEYFGVGQAPQGVPAAMPKSKANPGEQVFVDAQGNRAVRRDGKYVEVE